MLIKEDSISIINYYSPSPYLVDYLEKELHNLQPKSIQQDAGGPKIKYVRKEGTKGRIAKNKLDSIRKIFQGFIDLVYFLEFIEDHSELHEVFENELKDLFGISIDDSSPQRAHYKNRPTSLFYRLIRACLFNNLSYRQKIDFRVEIIEWLIREAINAMERRFEDHTESQLMRNNVANAKLWSELLAKRNTDKPGLARRRIGYSLPLTHVERMRDYSGKRDETNRLIEISKKLLGRKLKSKKRLEQMEKIRKLIDEVETSFQELDELGFSFPTNNLEELQYKIEALKATIRGSNS
jgi:hypothetical protein